MIFYFLNLIKNIFNNKKQNIYFYINISLFNFNKIKIKELN